MGLVGAEIRDLARAKGDHPCHRGIGFDRASPTAYGAASQHDNVVSDCPDVIGVRAQLVPCLGTLVEVAPDAAVAVIPPGLDKCPRQRHELSVGVVAAD